MVGHVAINISSSPGPHHHSSLRAATGIHYADYGSCHHFIEIGRHTPKATQHPYQKQAWLTTYQASKNTILMIPDLARALIVGAPYQELGVPRRRCLFDQQIQCSFLGQLAHSGWEGNRLPFEADLDFPTQGGDLLKNAPPLHTTPHHTRAHTRTRTQLTTPHASPLGPPVLGELAVSHAGPDAREDWHMMHVSFCFYVLRLTTWSN